MAQDRTGIGTGNGRAGAAPLTDGLRFSLRVPVHVRSIRFVRAAMRSFVDMCGEDVADRLAMIYSELINNVVKHARLGPSDSVEINLQVGGGAVVGQVADAGVGFDPSRLDMVKEEPLDAKMVNEGGLGLRIVERLARSWGVDRRRGRTEVWFAL